MALSLGKTRGHRTLLKGHRTLNTSVRCSNVSRVSESNGNLQSTGRLSKLAPDASGAHRTHAQRVPQTRRITGRKPPDAPSASGAHRTHAQRGSQNARTPDANHRTLKPASGAYRPVPYPSWARHCLHRTLRRSVRCSRSQRPVSVSQRETLPRLLQTSHRRNRKYALNFLKSAESRLASSAGGREEPTRLSTLGTPPPLKSVSIFTNIFPKELASQTCHATRS